MPPLLSATKRIQIMNLENTLHQFGNLVDKRLKLHGHLLSSEDTIRYDFFHALTKNDSVNSWDVVLEAPYPLDILSLDKNNSKIDLLINRSEMIDTGLMCEFKYDRKANSTVNKTNRYGNLINDLVRLCLLSDRYPEHHSIFVYVSDAEMMKYKPGFYHSQEVGSSTAITVDLVSGLTGSAKNQVKPVFLNPFREKQIYANCRLIYKRIEDNQRLQYGIYAWAISSSKLSISNNRSSAELTY